MAQLRTNLADARALGPLGVWRCRRASHEKPAAAGDVSRRRGARARRRNRGHEAAEPKLEPIEEREPSVPRGAAGLELVREELGDCQRCKLCTTRTNIVFGVGNPDADLVFVGEAPGADEDAQGEPFVGRRGSSDQDDRGDGLRAGRRLHLQRPQVPPARQP